MMKPCPFCGSDEIDVDRWDYNFFGALCGECGASASYCETREEAIEAWNERVSQPELLEVLEALYYLVSEVANPGAFDNGVYAPDGRCEGNVLAGEIIERARVIIAKAKE